MLIGKKLVAIIGGGPGGLTLARLLQLKGVNVKLYERDLNKNSRVQGGPLDLHEKSGLAALGQANLLEEFRAGFLSGADRMVIVNEQAVVLFNDHQNKHDNDFGSEHFRPEIDRGTLRKILLESLQPDTVVWDSQFVTLEKQGDGCLLNFENGSSAYADLVIGADGANSRVRPYLSNIKQIYSGITMIEGNVYNSEKATPNVHTLLKGGKIMAFGNERNLLLGQKGNGELGFYASFKADKSWLKSSDLKYTDNAQMLIWFKTTYAGWSEMWDELFRNATPPFIPRQINYMPLDQTWTASPNLTLIGDAAHLMPPFAGEGANMAMLDALKLSECLTSGKYISLTEAISSYELDMRRRATIATQESLKNGQRMHSATALTDMLEMFMQN